jgi:predicted anti-sigma-YlaC factor YlaD
MRWTRALNLALFMTCRDAAPRISHGMDRTLSLEDRTAVRLHLAICPSCRRYRRQIALLRRVLALMPHYPNRAGDEPLPAAARARIRRALEGPA